MTFGSEDARKLDFHTILEEFTEQSRPTPFRYAPIQISQYDQLIRSML